MTDVLKAHHDPQGLPIFAFDELRLHHHLDLLIDQVTRAAVEVGLLEVHQIRVVRELQGELLLHLRGHFDPISITV